MKRKTALILYGALVIVLTSVTGFELGKMHTARKGSSDYVSEQEVSDPFDGVVTTVQGTTTDMLQPGYWLTSNSGNELFSREEIEEFNSNNPAYVEYRKEKGESRRELYMHELPDTIDGRIVRALIDPEIIDDLTEDGAVLYAEREPVSADYWDKIRNNLNLEAIPEKVTPKYAICVKRTDARTLPCDDFIAEDPGEIYFDSLISAEVMPFAEVVVLSESSDGQWYYILCGSYCGWVHKETVALCKDRDEWLEASSFEDFLVVTGSEIVLEETAKESFHSGMVLPMGTRMKLLSSEDGTDSERMPWGCYRVELPCRSEDGTLFTEEALIPVSKDVHRGFLQMTSGAVLEQAFKFLGKIYGYGGTLSSNDCSGFVRQVYSCFGLELPRNARAIAKTYDLGSIECQKMTLDKKLSILEKMDPGALLYMEGHLMMYLGTKDGVPYVISSCATCIEPGHGADDIVDAYGVFVSSMELVRANGNTWLEDMNYILWRQY